MYNSNLLKIYMAAAQNLKPQSIYWIHKPIHTPDLYPQPKDIIKIEISCIIILFYIIGYNLLRNALCPFFEPYL